MAAPSDI